MTGVKHSWRGPDGLVMAGAAVCGEVSEAKALCMSSDGAKASRPWEPQGTGYGVSQESCSLQMLRAGEVFGEQLTWCSAGVGCRWGGKEEQIGRPLTSAGSCLGGLAEDDLILAIE